LDVRLEVRSSLADVARVFLSIAVCCRSLSEKRRKKIVSFSLFENEKDILLFMYKSYQTLLPNGVWDIQVTHEE
jgi:hypothetical protein